MAADMAAICGEISGVASAWSNGLTTLLTFTY